MHQKEIPIFLTHAFDASSPAVRRRVYILGGTIIVYFVLIRWLFLDYMYSHGMLGWYAALIQIVNRFGNAGFTYGPHPLEEYQQRLDIFLFQILMTLALFRSIWYIFRKKSRLLLLTINIVLLLLILSIFEIYLSIEDMQKKVGSVQYEKLDAEISKKNRDKQNSYRFTDCERSPKRAKGIFRIVVLGDSFVWGDGVENLDNVWSHILETKIGEKYGDSVEVVSWGRNGWSTYHQLEFLKGPGREFDVDYMVIGFVTNDPHIPGVSMSRRSFIWHKKVKPVLFFFKNTARFVTERINQFLYSLPYFANWGYDGRLNTLYSDGNLQAYEKVVRELGEYLRERGIGHVIVTLPMISSKAASETLTKKMHRLVFRIFESSQIPYLDLFPKVIDQFGGYDAQRIREEIWTNPVDPHPGKRLAELYANSVLHYLETNRILSSIKP